MRKREKRITAPTQTRKQLGDMRVRRPMSLVAFWQDGKFVIENYLSNKQVEVNPLIINLLQRMDEYRHLNDVLEIFGNIPKSDWLVQQLLKHDLLVTEGTALDIKDRSIEQSWKWNQDARYFHYSSQHVQYEGSIKKQREALAKLAETNPPPSPFKDYRDGNSNNERNLLNVKLAGSYDDNYRQQSRGEGQTQNDLWQSLLKRRTRRNFQRKKISFDDFSTLILWTWGRTHTIKSEIGTNLLKTSPSAGARHPIEVYPLVIRVKGADPGIYHYSVKSHELECIKKGMLERLALRLCSYQPWVRNASALFFMTAVLPRSMWKYNHSHAYRVVLLDAGHLGQTFHLVCTRLGLAPFTTAATKDKEIERALGIDGVSEIPVYTAAVGLPASGDNNIVPNHSIDVLPSVFP